MAQQFQGGGITYDQGAAVRQNAQILGQALSGVANQFNQNKMRFLEEYKAREQAFMAKAQASGIPLDAYILGPGAQEYSQLIGARNNIGRIFGQGQQAQQGAAAGEMARINENISPAAMGYAAQQEAMRRGLPEGGMVQTYGAAPAQAPVQPPTQAAAVQASAAPTEKPLMTPPVPARSAEVALARRSVRVSAPTESGEITYTAVDPVSGRDLGTFATVGEAENKATEAIQRGVRNPQGQAYIDKVRQVQEQMAPGTTAAMSIPVAVVNAPQTSTQARMADKQMAAKEAKAIEAAPAADALVARVVTGEKVDTKTAMKGFAAAKQLGNYFDNIKQVPDNELQAMVAKWKNDVNNMTPEELELAGMSNVASRRAMSQQLEAAANLELMKAKIMAASDNGQAASKLAEQAVKAIEALQKMEGDIPELMKAQGIKNRADFMAKNPDYEANLKTARRFAGELTGIKIPDFTAIPSGFFFWQKGKFVPTDTMSAIGAATGNSKVEDAWAEMQ